MSKTIREVLETYIPINDYLSNNSWKNDVEQALLDIIQIIDEAIGENEYNEQVYPFVITEKQEREMHFLSTRDGLRRDIRRNLKEALK